MGYTVDLLIVSVGESLMKVERRKNKSIKQMKKTQRKTLGWFYNCKN